ncbi:MAG: LysR substrate-binding domain-containing protein [Pseudomonadota bacterium]
MSQRSNNVSLNALRVFAMSAERMSLKLAAEEIGVTPGAVSHQIRSLEDALGTPLFLRRHNSIGLTAAGERLLDRARPGLNLLEGAISDVVRTADEISVQAPTTLAIRWLIPALDQFRKRHPRARIQVETHDGLGPGSRATADVVICYHRVSEAPEDADILMQDTCRPYVAPPLLARWPDVSHLAAIPALQCGADNWDWQLWLRNCNRTGVALTYGDRFDLDDAGLRAAIAGIGMVLAPEFMIAGDISARRLAALPGAPGSVLGVYTVETSGRETGLLLAFGRWLRSLASRDG